MQDWIHITCSVALWRAAPCPFERLETSILSDGGWLAYSGVTKPVWPGYQLICFSFSQLSHEICSLAALCSLVGMAGNALRPVCPGTRYFVVKRWTKTTGSSHLCLQFCHIIDYFLVVWIKYCLVADDCGIEWKICMSYSHNHLTTEFWEACISYRLSRTVLVLWFLTRFQITS